MRPPAARARRRASTTCGRLAWLLALGLVGSALPLADRVHAEATDASVDSPPARYRVYGATTDKATGAQRDIEGMVVLEQKGDAYTSSFELRTVLAGSEATPAHLLGTGSGRVEGTTLRGTADTQILTSDVPGIDAGFVGMPRQVSMRVRSTSLATIGADGTLSISIESEPVSGEGYRPTHTVLRGTRVGLEPAAPKP